MSRFTGRQPRYEQRGAVMRMFRELKREEAGLRDKALPEDSPKRRRNRAVITPEAATEVLAAHNELSEEERFAEFMANHTEGS